MSTPIRSIHLLIRGRVQGVWYRASARDQAVRLGLAGWVRNLDDGRVEAMASGESTALDAFVSWCRSGPPGARVDEISVQPAAIDVLPSPFEVQR